MAATMGNVGIKGSSFMMPPDLADGSYMVFEEDDHFFIQDNNNEMIQLSIPYDNTFSEDTAFSNEGYTLSKRSPRKPPKEENPVINRCFSHMELDAKNTREAWKRLTAACKSDDKRKKKKPVAIINQVGDSVAYMCNWGIKRKACVWDEMARVETANACSGTPMLQPDNDGGGLIPNPPLPGTNTTSTPPDPMPTPPVRDDKMFGARGDFKKKSRGYGWGSKRSQEICAKL
ncbi:hypothetical protein BJ170DRAFT_697503 [Xylariales sp. AK1849]|nr:hypothetical protein BJ170DRAFT_697503 [Xylariales sp. AK1849]